MTELYFPKNTGPTRKQRKARKIKNERDLRVAVWVRDHGRDRATGQPLTRDAYSDELRGEVHHLRGRNVMPEWKYDPRRAVLLAASNHRLVDARGNYRLKPTDPETGEPATDASKPIRWTLYDKDGNVEWSRIS